MVEISRHPELYCSGQSGTTIFDMPPELLEFFGSMINMDDPRHARLRRIVSAAFNPRMVRAIEDNIEQVADDLIATVRAKGECDFVTEVAARLPLKIICDMMGVPESEYDTVFSRSNIILSFGDPEYVPEGEDPVLAFMNAGNDLAELMRGLAAYRLEHPTDDLTSALVNANVDGESLTDSELASFFILLVVAGNETTRNAISHGLWAFTEHPDQRAVWAADFDTVAPTAVDEIVRWASPVIFMRRTTTAPTTLSGHEFAEGRQVHPLLQLGQPRRGRLRGSPALRRPAPSQSPCRLRRPRPALLPRRPPGSPRDHGDVPRALPPSPRHPRHGRARPIALELHQRHQAPALRVLRRRRHQGAGPRSEPAGNGTLARMRAKR